MSGNPNFSTHAGAIDGLELGKPIAGGEHPTLPSSGLNVPAGSSTGSTGAGLTGSDLSRSAVASGVGAGVGAGVGPGSGISSGAYNTAGGSSGLTGNEAHLRDTQQGVNAGMGIGHNEDGRAQYEIIDGKPKETAGLATSGEFNEARKEAPPAGTKIGGNAGFAAAGGAAAAGVTGAALASRDTSTTSGSGSGGPGSKIGEVAHSADPEALKQELKRNQEAGGYDSSNAHHVETEGPHGLVWDGEKYVHRREIDHKGSTGVPLQ